MHLLTADGRIQQLRVEMVAANGTHYYEVYGDFWIGPARDFQLHIGNYRGTACKLLISTRLCKVTNIVSVGTSFLLIQCVRGSRLFCQREFNFHNLFFYEAWEDPNTPQSGPLAKRFCTFMISRVFGQVLLRNSTFV